MATKFSFKSPSAARPHASVKPLAAPRQKLTDLKLPEGPPPQLAWTGVTRFAKVHQAMMRLAQAGFDEGVATDELVSLSGRFASIEPLSNAPDGPCDVHVRLAMTKRPRG